MSHSVCSSDATSVNSRSQSQRLSSCKKKVMLENSRNNLVRLNSNLPSQNRCIWLEKQYITPYVFRANCDISANSVVVIWSTKRSHSFNLYVSRAFDRVQVFPHFSMGTSFPALSACYVFHAFATHDVLLRFLIGLLRYSQPPDWLIHLESV